jgi:hypothetical protein
MRTDKAERITITLPPDMLATIKNKVQSGCHGAGVPYCPYGVDNLRVRQEGRSGGVVLNLFT